jgi:SAM-dependent methyltransferase
VDELVVPPHLHRNAIPDGVAALDGAVWLIDHMCGHIAVPDLGRLDVLDFGCGVRFTQAIVNRGVPIGHYVGVDVSPEVVDFLQANVSDPRLEHFRLDAHNDRYNPTGRPLAELSVPEIEGRRFDLICLFSVFTHLSPPDYVAMLELLRRYISDDGSLFYTLFVNEVTEGGHGYIDKLNQASAARAAGAGEPPDFVDASPAEPLMAAVYSRRHALTLIEGTGWKLRSLSPPNIHGLQHHIVCTPRIDRSP